MSAAVLLADLAACGVQLEVDGDRIRYRARRGALTPDLAERIRGSREDLLRLLDEERIELRHQFEERAGVREFDGGLPRADAEREAWADVADDLVESDPVASAMSIPDARAWAAARLQAAGIVDPESLTPEQRCGRVAPPDDAFDLVVCCDCAIRVWRPRHPTLGTPVRCWTCEQNELKTLLRLAGRGLIAPTRTCAGCRESMPETGHALCFGCDLGLERGDESPARVRIAVELRAQLGPAGGRGLRKQAIDTEMRRRAEERKGARKAVRATRPTGATKEGK